MLVSALKPWTWIHRLPHAVFTETSALLQRLAASREMLWAVTKVDFRKKYAGSVLGLLWYPLYSGLLLAMYCFIYMVVFAQKFENMGRYDFVLFIFAGLVPYLAFSDAVVSSVTSIKANITLVKNTIFPVELIPVKQYLVSLAGSGVTMVVLILLILPTDLFGWHLLYLPVSILLLTLFSLAVNWVLAGVAVLVPDLNYIVNLLLLVAMFVSPIGFSLDQVPEHVRFVMYLNPLTYLVESFRYAFIGVRFTPLWIDLVFGVGSALGFALSATLFRRLIPLFSDHE